LNFLKSAALVVFIVGIPIALWIGVRLLPPQPNAQVATHSDLISTLLAGIAICLGALAIVIAGLAIWGYAAIKTEAGRIAKSCAMDAVEAHMTLPAQQKELSKLLKRMIETELKNFDIGMSMASAYTDQAKTSESGSVGKRYPRKVDPQ
jgi:hypothetical protein